MRPSAGGVRPLRGTDAPKFDAASGGRHVDQTPVWPGQAEGCCCPANGWPDWPTSWPAIRPPLPPVNPGALIRRRIAYAGSLIGGIAETQEMLDFCAEHGVVADIEVVAAGQLNEAYDRMVAGDVKYRFVLDTSTLQAAAEEADA